MLTIIQKTTPAGIKWRAIATLIKALGGEIQCRNARLFGSIVTLDDAVNYIHFHLKRAEAPVELFADNAIKAIFHRAKGLPRRINQIAIHALIRAAVLRKDKIDEPFLKQQVFTSALFDPNFDEQ